MGAARPSVAVIPDPWRRPLRRLGLTAALLALVASTGTVARAQLDTAPVAAGSGAVQALLLSGSSLSYAEAHRTARELQWQTSVYSLPGAGLSRSTLDGDGRLVAAAARLLTRSAAHPDVVVVQGGEADHASSAPRVQRAAEHLLDYLRTHTGPRTRLVLVGPIPGATTPDSLRMVSAVLAEVAAGRGVPYVDPIALGWRARDPAVPGRLAAELAAATPGA